MLDCYEPSPAPCRGFTGDCAGAPKPNLPSDLPRSGDLPRSDLPQSDLPRVHGRLRRHEAPRSAIRSAIRFAILYACDQTCGLHAARSRAAVPARRSSALLPALRCCQDVPSAKAPLAPSPFADLPAQFADVVPNPFEGYECHQFPDPVLGTLCPIPDKIVVSLIMVAVAIPTRLVIGRLFEVRSQSIPTPPR